MIEWLWALFAVSWLALEVRAAVAHWTAASERKAMPLEPIAGSITPAAPPQRQAS